MPDISSNVVMWAGLVGFFLPPALALVLQSAWSPQVKSVVAFIVCGAAGFGTAYFSGFLDGKDLVTITLIVLTVTQATYHGFWKPSGVAGAIERSTSP